MCITINGEAREVPDGVTVLELLRFLELNGPVAVERNRSIVPRADHASTALAPGDILEVVHFVGGG